MTIKDVISFRHNNSSYRIIITGDKLLVTKGALVSSEKNIKIGSRVLPSRAMSSFGSDRSYSLVECTSGNWINIHIDSIIPYKHQRDIKQLIAEICL